MNVSVKGTLASLVIILSAAGVIRVLTRMVIEEPAGGMAGIRVDVLADAVVVVAIILEDSALVS